jgi:hypothetical protein
MMMREAKEQTSWVNDSLVYEECASSRLFIHPLLEVIIFREYVQHKGVGAGESSDIPSPIPEWKIDLLLSNDCDGLINTTHRNNREHRSKNFSMV